MNSFQIIVLSIFVILAILILTAFTIMLTSKKDSDSEYPTSYSQCPDYWDVSGNLCIIQRTDLNNGDGSWQSAGNTVAFDSTTQTSSTRPGANFKDASWDTKYPSITGRCALKKWANTYGIVWDGITNYNSAYC